MKTQLKDRTLWYDGDSTIASDQLMNMLMQGYSHDRHQLCVDDLTNDIKQFNKYLPVQDRIAVKTQLRPLNYEWNLPQFILDKVKTDTQLEAFIKEKFISKCIETDIPDEDIPDRLARVTYELSVYKRHNLYNVLRTLVYIMYVFEENNIVWGVGRGSSVSSYVLYVMGVHDVDSVLYDLNLEEFIKESN